MLPYCDKKKAVKLLIVTVMLAVMQPLFAQKDKGTIKKMKEADNLVLLNDYYNALDIYKEIWAKDSSDAKLAYQVGFCMYNMRSTKSGALPYFEKALKGGVEKASYYLGNLYHLDFRFEEALNAYNRYTSIPESTRDYSNTEVDRLKAATMTAMEMMKHPVNVNVINMGPVINSIYADYSPILSQDGSRLIFTSRRKGSTGNLTDAYKDYYEDIYVSKLVNGTWTNPTSISPNINSESHDACVALSPSEKVLLIYRTNEDLTAGDIYVSRAVGNEWTKPEMLESQINTDEGWEASATISADSTVLYFSSNRAGGYGGKDLYRVAKLPNGQWSLPLNLGPVINTPLDDDAPFIHCDGRTLYFSSRGHTGMGGYDVYKTMLDDEGAWSQPENMGFPVNSVDDDIYFITAPDGSEGYFSSARPESYGQTDLFNVKLFYTDIAYSVVRGMVISSDTTRKTVAAKITLIDDDTKQVTGIYTSTGRGRYLIVVSPEKRYKVVVEAEGYFPFTDLLSFSPNTPDNEMELIIELTRKRP